MRKFSSLLLLVVLLVLPFEIKVSAEVDSNIMVDDMINNTPTESDTEDSDDASKTETHEDVESGGVSITIWDYVKMVLALGFVVLLLYGLLYFVNSRNKSFQKNKLIHNLGGVGISQGKSVQLLQVGDSLLLVGIGEDITLLKEFENPEEIEKLTKIYEEKQDVGKPVLYITELISRVKDSFSTKTIKNDSTFNEIFKKRLQEVKKDRSEVLEDWKTKERKKNE